ncbi:MAG TPA: DUF427 domain-containing protein [Streptosporangiaceae bacterium]|jgi:uncharacterized protein (DUF427 family)
MGLSWQQGPLAPGAVGRFLVPDPLPERMLFAEPLRRRMRVRFGGAWIADSEDVVLLHEPGRYPVAYFPLGDVSPGVLEPSGYRTRHRDLGDTSWFTVHAGSAGSAGASSSSGSAGSGGAAGAEGKQRAAWEHTGLPDYAGELKGRAAFAWRAMDAFYEEDERIVGHAADAYHRIDIRPSSRHLTVRSGDRVVADTTRPLALYESGFAPRWYVPRADVDESALTAAPLQTFCPYKGVCSYWDIGDARQAAWSYLDAFTEVGRVSGLISFEPDKIEVQLDGARLRLEPGQGVLPHGVDRNLDLDESGPGRQP